jgi:hypothetical protein
VRRPLILALLSAVLLAQPAAAIAMSSGAAAPAGSESGSPIDDQGSNFNYRSNITAVTPRVPGLSLQVLEFADRLLLRNRTGRTITVYGYQGEPYARVQGGGAVEVNTRSPAYYLDQSFYGNVTVPASASPSASPHWVLVDRTGQFEWHDHRIHWMSPLTPPQVKDKSKRTLIFDWQVPIAVGARRGTVAGQLFWTPESSKAPVTAIVLGALIVLLGLLFVLVVRRRRAHDGAVRAGGVSGGEEERPPREAW